MGGPQNAGFRAELGGKDRQALRQRGGKLRSHDLLERLEQQCFGLGYPSADDNRLRI